MSEDELLRSHSFVRQAADGGLSSADVDLLYARAERYARRGESIEDAEVEDYVGFVRCGTSYAIPVLCLQRIVTLDHLNRIPGGPAHVPGVFAYRGEILSAHDLAAFLGVSELERPSWALIVDGPVGALGLLADEITTLFPVREGDVRGVPLTLGERGAGFSGILTDGTLLVRPTVLFEDPAFVYAFGAPRSP